MKTTANEIADFFINFCYRHGDYITNLKLQKLLYFAQGWYLAFYNKPLFDDEIQAWVHGPVVPIVYQRFKRYQHNPITEDIAEQQLSESIVNHLVDVFEYYGKYSAYDLEKISHESTPWINARGNLPFDEPSNQAICIEDMRIYYSSLASKDEKTY